MANSNNLSKRGKIFTGTVVSDKMHKTVTVQWDWMKHVQKYERYSKKRSRAKAHNPEEINAKVGDIVKIAETRPISKTKKFIVTKIVGKKEAEPAEAIEREDKKKKTPAKSKESKSPENQGEKTIEK